MMDTWLYKNPVILLTRPKAASVNLAATLHVALPESRIVISPLISLNYLNPTPDFSRYAALVVTSSNAIDALGAQSIPHGYPCYAVGHKTAQAAQALGFEAHSANGDASDLVRLIVAQHKSGPLLHIHGRHTRGDVAQRLQHYGIHCETLIAYDQKALTLSQDAQSLLEREIPLILPLFSPRTAQIFLDQAQIPMGSTVLGMSNAVIAPFKHINGINLHAVAEPNLKDMTAAICNIYKKQEQVASGEGPN